MPPSGRHDKDARTVVLRMSLAPWLPLAAFPVFLQYSGERGKLLLQDTVRGGGKVEILHSGLVGPVLSRKGRGIRLSKHDTYRFTWGYLCEYSK